MFSKMAAAHFKLLIRSAKQIVQVVKNGERVVVGEDMKKISVLEGAENDRYSLVVSKLVILLFSFTKTDDM